MGHKLDAQYCLTPSKCISIHVYIGLHVYGSYNVYPNVWHGHYGHYLHMNEKKESVP